MSSSISVLPSTLEGIKRLATSIKREQQIPHTKALDVAAQRAGFGNFRNAQHELSRSAPARATTIGITGHPIWITAYWRDKENRTGRETLQVAARQPWPRLLKPSELTASRGLCAFRVDAADHFETPTDLHDQAAAQRAVCEAARTLQFMEVTGLRPLTGNVYRATKGVDKMPRRDHATAWRDPNEAIVVVDEPYSGIQTTLSEREPWARSTESAIAATKWAGMYFPGAATMFLTSLDGRKDLLARLVSQLDAAPPPVDAEAWPGESAPYTSIFISPARASSGKSKRARPKPLDLGLVRRNAIVYGRSGYWRPNARMPLPAHREAGNLLKELLGSGGLRTKAYSGMSHVRSELDEWVQREYLSQKELSTDEFNELYYHAFKPSGLTPIEAIARIEELLLAHYPDCVPRRSLARCLVAGRKDLQRLVAEQAQRH